MDWGRSLFQGSYQSRLETAQSNNRFASDTLFAGDCDWCGATNSYQTASAGRDLAGYGVDPQRPRNELEERIITLFAIQEGTLGYQSTTPTGRLIKQMKDRGEPGRGRGSEPTAGSIRNINPSQSMSNCAYCAIATDAMLKGRPIGSALPGGRTRISVLEQIFGSKFGPKMNLDEIAKAMSVAGPGTHGIVFASRGAGKDGHVFNVVNQRGIVRFLDGQIGTTPIVEGQGFQSFQLLRTD